MDPMAAYGIRCTTTPPYNPKSNPVERAHRTLGAVLSALLEPQGSDWEEVLPHAVYAMNVSTSAATGLSLFEALYGRPPSTTLDVLFGSPPTAPPISTDPKSFAHYLRMHKDRIARIHGYVRRHLHAAVERQRRRYNLECAMFGPGDKVWLFTPVPPKGKSL